MFFDRVLKIFYSIDFQKFWYLGKAEIILSKKDLESINEYLDESDFGHPHRKNGHLS